MAFLAKFLFFIAAFLAVDAQNHGGRHGGDVGEIGDLIATLQFELVNSILAGGHFHPDTVVSVVGTFKNVFGDFVDHVNNNVIHGVSDHDIGIVKGIFADISQLFGLVLDDLFGISGGSDKGHTGKGHSGKGHTGKGHTGKGHSGKGHTGKGHTGKGHSDGGRHFSHGTY